jgi:hypothetical protein
MKRKRKDIRIVLRKFEKKRGIVYEEEKFE